MLPADDDALVEMRVTDHTLEQTHPERHHHFCAARGCDVANIDDVVDLPAEPFVQIFGDFVFRRGVVAADEQIVIAGTRDGSTMISQFTVLSALTTRVNGNAF